MSEFHVEVVQIDDIRTHPNADQLSIAVVKGYPVVIRKDSFKIGDKAVHVPIDAQVPLNHPLFSFLLNKDKPKEFERVKAKKLRGTFSMGLLVPANLEWEVGRNVQEELGVTKYEPPLPMVMGGENEPDPGFLPQYTDIEGLRKFENLLAVGEEVALTEKTHGTNCRFIFNDGRLWVGSHHCIKRKSDTQMLWKLAERYNLEAKLSEMPGIAIYGEAYGSVQDLKYGCAPGEVKLLLFDALDIQTRTYKDYDEFKAIALKLGIPTAPELYRGSWSPDLRSHGEGLTTLGAKHVREGFVVRPVKERFSMELGGRLVLKYPGEGYFLR